MHEKTESNLLAAFAGESQAHMRYMAFAERARKDGFPNIARLFEAVAFAEKVHATGHLNELDRVKSSVENLAAAVEGENYEVQQMYPGFKATAEAEGERGAVRSIHHALEAEKIHAVLYANAQALAQNGKDTEAGTVQVCPVCGHTVIGEAPDRCPVCGAPRARFRAF